MSRIEPLAPNPPVRFGDLDHAIDLLMKRRTDPEFAARIQAESATITEEIRRTQGLLDIGVPAIRELRGELPKP